MPPSQTSSSQLSSASSTSVAVQPGADMCAVALPLQPSPLPRARNRAGILSRGHSLRSPAHLTSTEPSLVYPSASEDDAEGDLISDSGPMPRRFPPSNPTSARSSSSLQSQYRSASQGSVPISAPRTSNEDHRGSNAATSSVHSIDPKTSQGAVDVSRAKSISSVSSVASTSSMEAAPFRAPPLGKIRMSYTGGGASTINRGQLHALRLHAPDVIAPGTVAGGDSPAPDAGGMAAFLEAAQEAAIAAAEQQRGELQDSEPFDVRMGGSAELPRRVTDVVGPAVKVVSSPAAALAARQKGFLPKAPSNEWLYRNGPGLRTHLGGKVIPGSYRSLAEMTYGTAESAVGMTPQPCPSPTSKRTAAVIRNKLAKSASKLGLKPLTIVPGATPSHPRIAAEFAESASTTSEALDVQQDLISSATGAALSDPRAINVRPRSVALTSSLLNTIETTSIDSIVKTSPATNAPLIVPRLSPHPDATQRMSNAGGLYVGQSPTHDLKLMAKRSTSPSGSPHSHATGDDGQVPPILNHLAGGIAKADGVTSKTHITSSPTTNDRPTSPSMPGGRTISKPTPAEVVRMEAQAGIARLPTVGSGPTPGPTPTILRPLSPSSSTPPSAHPHSTIFTHSSSAALAPSTIWNGVGLPPVSSAEASGDRHATRPKATSWTRPAIRRSSSSQSNASLSSSKSHESLANGSEGSGVNSETANGPRFTSGLSSLNDFQWNNMGSSGITRQHTGGASTSAGKAELERLQGSSSILRHSLPVQKKDHLNHRRVISQEIRSGTDGHALEAEALSTTTNCKAEQASPHGGLFSISSNRLSRSRLLRPDGSDGDAPKSVHPMKSYPEAHNPHSPGLAPPMLRMGTSNTAVSKAVSDTSDMAPPIPFKRPAMIVAGRMTSSDNRYDVMEGSMDEHGGEDELSGSSGAVPITADESLEKLSVIAEASPDTRSSQASTNTMVSSSQPVQEKVTAEARSVEAKASHSVAHAPPTSRPRGRDDFEFGDILGEGSYSTVIQAWDLLTHSSISASPRPRAVTSVASALSGSGSKADASLREGKRAYAIKVLDKVHILKERKQKYVAVEKEALSLLIRHPGIVKLYWTFQDQESLYFVLELALNGELLSFIKQYGSFNEDTTRYYAAQLLDAIAGMHSLGVIHRDIKPENVLLDDKMRIKVTDFGSAKIITKTPSNGSSTGDSAPSRANSFVGTAEYVSPELLTDKAASKESDFWAFGCVVFQMLTGRPPFKASSEYQTFQKIIKRDFEMPSDLSDEARDLLDKLLALEPDQRLRETEIRSHPFFKGIDWTTLWDREAPTIKTGIQPAPPPKEEHGRDLDALNSFGDEDWVNDHGFAFGEDGQDFSEGKQSLSPPLAQQDDSSDDEANYNGQSQDAPSDLISLQSGNRADIEDDESASSSHSHLAPHGLTAAVPTATSQSSHSVLERSSSQPTSLSIRHPAAVLNWAALLLPHETVLYASPTIHRKTGTANLQSKKRMLILTDFPRLLCVKENAQSLKVKSEVLLTMPGEGNPHKLSTVTAHGDRPASLSLSTPAARRASVSTSPSMVVVINVPTTLGLLNVNPNVLLSIEQRGTKTLLIHTPARSYTYEDPSGDASNWMRSIRAAAGR